MGEVRQGIQEPKCQAVEPPAVEGVRRALWAPQRARSMLPWRETQTSAAGFFGQTNQADS